VKRGIAAAALVACAHEQGFATASYEALVRADRPSSYWRFDEKTAAEGARDEMGRAPAAYGGGVALGAPGALGIARPRGEGSTEPDTAATFDGATSMVIGPDIYSFGGNAPFTIEVWVSPAGGGAPIQRLCNHRHGPPHTGWLLFLDPARRVAFERWSGEIVLGSVAADVPSGAYSYVVVRYDGAELSLWIDGVRQITSSDPTIAYGILNDLHPDQIAAIEVYPRGATTPVEFATLNSSCGAVVVWTKWALHP